MLARGCTCTRTQPALREAGALRKNGQRERVRALNVTHGGSCTAAGQLSVRGGGGGAAHVHTCNDVTKPARLLKGPWKELEPGNFYMQQPQSPELPQKKKRPGGEASRVVVVGGVWGGGVLVLGLPQHAHKPKQLLRFSAETRSCSAQTLDLSCSLRQKATCGRHKVGGGGVWGGGSSASVRLLHNC